jgi:hypothetical protein
MQKERKKDRFCMPVIQCMVQVMQHCTGISKMCIWIWWVEGTTDIAVLDLM